MRELKVGLIGLGFMGTTHWGIHRQQPGVRVAAIADIDPVKRRGDVSSVIGNLGGGDNSKPLDLSGVKIYDDGFALIADPEIDVVDICVPTPDHAELIVAALKAGKHVFSEKPLCRRREEMAKIAAAVKDAPGFFNVGMCIRAWPEYRHAKEFIDAGKAGKIMTAEFRRYSPDISGNNWDNWFMNDERSGGALHDMHLHDADAVVTFFGRPAAVSSFGLRGMVGDGGIDQVTTVYDFGPDMLVTASGGWGCARNMPFEMSFQIVGQKATLKMDGSGYHIYHADGTVEAPVCAEPGLPTGWHVELKYFIDCIRAGIRPEKYQTMQSVFDGFSVILAETLSVDSGKKVKVEYV